MSLNEPYSRHNGSAAMGVGWDRLVLACGGRSVQLATLNGEKRGEHANRTANRRNDYTRTETRRIRSGGCVNNGRREYE